MSSLGPFGAEVGQEQIQHLTEEAIGVVALTFRQWQLDTLGWVHPGKGIAIRVHHDRVTRRQPSLDFDGDYFGHDADRGARLSEALNAPVSRDHYHRRMTGKGHSQPGPVTLTFEDRVGHGAHLLLFEQ